MIKKVDKGEEYIRKFPKFKRWINECVCCHKKGYDPSIPEKLGDGLGVYYIKKYYKPLELNEIGLCSVCSKLLK